MEKINYLLAGVIMCLSLGSCGNVANYYDEEVSNVSTDKSSKAIALNFNEEQVSMSQDPLTRGVTNEVKKYYGINIYEKVDSTYKKYAYGMFDGTSQISAILNEGKKYKVEVMELKNDEDTVYHEGNKFYAPFLIDNKNPATLTNSFTYSSSANLVGIAKGLTKYGKAKGDTTLYIRAYRYYGVLEDFDPSGGNSLAMTLRRTIFGLHFQIIPPEYGSVHMVYLNDHFIDISAGDEEYDHESIYSFNSLAKACNDGYKADIHLRAIWTANEDTIVNQRISIPVARNNVTNVKLNFRGPKSVDGSFNEENGEMENSSFNWTFTAE